MAVRLSLAFYGEAQLDRTLARLADNVDDARPVWEALADRFARVERRQFASEGGNSGGWPDLSPAYAAAKTRSHPGKPILERDGDLKRSLTRRPFGVEVIEPGYMIVGSAVPYGRWHQQGTPTMPRRRPVEFTEGERRTWVRLLQRFLVTGIATDRL